MPTHVLKVAGNIKYRTHCRCGEPLSFACEDIKTGQPAEDTDFWCSVQDPEKAPHDWGVVKYQ